MVIPKKAKREAGDHGEETLPAPLEESRPAFVIIPKPKRFNFLHSHGMRLNRSSIGWEMTPRLVDHLPTGIRNSSPPKRRQLTKRRVRHQGRSVRSAVIKVRDPLRPKQNGQGYSRRPSRRSLLVSGRVGHRDIRLHASPLRPRVASVPDCRLHSLSLSKHLNR